MKEKEMEEKRRNYDNEGFCGKEEKYEILSYKTLKKIF